MKPGAQVTERLRVVTLVSGIGLSGGAERLAREVTLRLDPERFRRTLCVSRWPDERLDAAVVEEVMAELAAADVRFIGLDRRGPYDLLSWRPLMTVLRNEADIVHSHLFGSNVWAAVLGTVARTPVIVAHEHTWSFQGQPVRKLLDRRLIAARADAFLAVSRLDRERMIEIERIDPGKLSIVPNGIPEAPARGSLDIRSELGITADVPVIGTVCVLRKQKALTMLIEAAAELVRRFGDVKVLIVGEGPERPTLERRIADLDLTGVVRLLGHRDDVPDVIRGFDVAVCSSDFEGTPLSILEYMQAELPIVATRVGGIPDVIDDGVHGLLVEPGDPGGFADAVGRVLTDSGLATKLAAAGRARQQAEFDIDVTVDAIERLYESLAGGRTAAGFGSER
jgi:glycosyltransferase involved in cell wall biosynthesis